MPDLQSHLVQLLVRLPEQRVQVQELEQVQVLGNLDAQGLQGGQVHNCVRIDAQGGQILVRDSQPLQAEFRDPLFRQERRVQSQFRKGPEINADIPQGHRFALQLRCQEPKGGRSGQDGGRRTVPEVALDHLQYGDGRIGHRADHR